MKQPKIHLIKGISSSFINQTPKRSGLLNSVLDNETNIKNEELKINHKSPLSIKKRLDFSIHHRSNSKSTPDKKTPLKGKKSQSRIS